jgi:hypothetical protein
MFVLVYFRYKKISGKTIGVLPIRINSIKLIYLLKNKIFLAPCENFATLIS